MDSLEYQRRLAEFDQQITFHEAKAKIIENERAQFILDVFKATEMAKKESKLPDGISVIKKE